MRTLPFVLHDVAQQSEAWRALRLGKLTGTGAADILATIKSGEAAARRNLRLRLILERLTGKPIDNGFVATAAMQAGIEREGDARAAYEALTGQLVTESGFCAHPTLMAGCSLDGHIGEFERLLSIKCRQPAAHWEFLRFGTIPVSALAQMRHEAWITGAEAHDYFSWNPDFPPLLQARVKTLSRDELDIPAYEHAALLFLDEVDPRAQCDAGLGGGRLMTPWRLSYRFDPQALPLADRHYNRQHIGAPQFVPPGRCLVLLEHSRRALWVTSWPFAQYVKHQWAGAWVNSLFRNEAQDTHLSSDLIAAAVSLTRAKWTAPPLGIVSFIDATQTRRKRDPGRCYRKAGWTHVGFTEAGLWVMQQLPHQMPEPDYSLSGQLLEVAV